MKQQECPVRASILTCERQVLCCSFYGFLRYGKVGDEMNYSNIKTRNKAVAFFVAVLLTVTSVLFDFPIKSNRVSAITSFTFYTNGSNIDTFFLGRVDGGKLLDNSPKSITGSISGSSVTGANSNHRLYTEKLSGYTYRIYSNTGDLAVGADTTPSNDTVKKTYWGTSSQLRDMSDATNTILAQFIPDNPTYTVTYRAKEGGVIKVGGGNIQVDSFTNYEETGGIGEGDDYYFGVTAVPNDDYIFIGWFNEAGTARWGGAGTNPFKKNQNTANGSTVYATFAYKYPVTYTLDGTVGTLTKTGSNDYCAYYAIGNDSQKRVRDATSNYYNLQGATVSVDNSSDYTIKWYLEGDETNALGSGWSFVPNVSDVEALLADGKTPSYVAKLTKESSTEKKIKVNYVVNRTAYLNTAVIKTKNNTAKDSDDYYVIGQTEQPYMSDTIGLTGTQNRQTWVYWESPTNEKFTAGTVSSTAYNISYTEIEGYILAYLENNPNADSVTFTAYEKNTAFYIVDGSSTVYNNKLNIVDGKYVNLYSEVSANIPTGKVVDYWQIQGDSNTSFKVYSSNKIRNLSTADPPVEWINFLSKTYANGKAENQYKIEVHYRNKKITVSQDDSSNGSIKYTDSDGTYTYYDETILPSATGTLTATPSNSSQLFDYWEIISPNGSVDVSQKVPMLNLTTLNPDDDTKIIAHYKSAFSITVEQNNDEYGNILFQNATSSQTINSVTTLSESTGTLTANPKEGFALENWSVKYSNGNVEYFTEETIDLSTIGADNGTSITANYKIADGWVMIRYEVIDTKNNIRYPIKLKFADDDEDNAIGSYAATNNEMPVLTEMVNVGAGNEAVGCEALMLSEKYPDTYYYKFIGWQEETGYIFQEDSMIFKPTGKYLYDRVGNTTDNIITYQAHARQTKNFYIVTQYGESIEGYTIYDARASWTSATWSQAPITNSLTYIGYVEIGEDGNIAAVHPFKNYDEKTNKETDVNFYIVPGAELPLGYTFQYWELTGTDKKDILDSSKFSVSSLTFRLDSENYLTKDLIRPTSSYKYNGTYRAEGETAASAGNGDAAYRQDIKDWATAYMLSSLGKGDEYSHTILLKCYVEPTDCVIEITKHIDEAPEGFGNPQFIFKVEGRETINYTTLDQTKMTQVWSADGTTATIRFVVPKGEYVVTEVDTLRYTLSSVEGVANSPGDDPKPKNKTEIDSRTTIVPNDSGTVKVTFQTGNGKAELTFDNTLSNHGKRSYSDSKVNTITIPAAS